MAVARKIEARAATGVVVVWEEEVVAADDAGGVGRVWGGGQGEGGRWEEVETAALVRAWGQLGGGGEAGRDLPGRLAAAREVCATGLCSGGCGGGEQAGKGRRVQHGEGGPNLHAPLADRN